MQGQQAGKIRVGYIVFMTTLYTIWACIKTISGSYTSKEYRPFVDKVLMKWSLRLMSLINVTTRVIGQENLPKNSKQPVIVMCNHSSLYDVPAAIIALDTTFRFIAKKELFSIPIFGSAMRKAEIVSIDRHNHYQARDDLKRAKEKMLEGVVLWIAPEGTTSSDGRLAPFKKGGFHIAIETSALIVPIVLKDIHKIQSNYKLDIFMNQELEVHICDAIDASDYTVENREELMSKVRKQMLTIMGQEE